MVRRGVRQREEEFEARAERFSRRIGRIRVGRPRARRRPPLVIAALIGATAWLDGQVRWREDSLVWLDAVEIVVPTGGSLALTERRLLQLERLLRTSRRDVTDHRATLERRRARLAIARVLVRLDLGGQSWPENAADLPIERTVALLAAEAHCLDDLPFVPSRVVLAAGSRALPHLDRMIADSDADTLTRALAALARGAISARAGTGAADLSHPWLCRAHAKGLQHGLSSAPTLVATLLEPDDGASLADRYLATLDEGNPFLLPPNWLRGLLVRGHTVSQIVALSEAMARLRPLVAWVRAYRDELPERDSDLRAYRQKNKRRVQAVALRQSRREALERLVRQAHLYAWQTATPAALDHFGAFVGAMLALRLPRAEALKAIEGTLADGLTLPDHLQGGFLAILAGEFEQIWDRSDGLYDETRPDYLVIWLTNGRRFSAHGVLRLLQQTGDVTFTREATRRRAFNYLAHEVWRDPETYRWALAMQAAFYDDAGQLPGGFQLHTIYRALAWFATEAEGRKVLNACLAMLHNVPSTLRAGFLIALLQGAGSRTGGEAAALRLLLPQVPPLVRFLAANGDAQSVSAILPGLLLMLRRDATVAAARRDWVCERLAKRLAARPMDEHGEPEWFDREPLELGLLIAATLAPDDEAHFRAIFAVASDADYNRDGGSTYRRALTILEALPELRHTIAASFARQHARCLALIARLGRAAQLGASGVTPIVLAYRQDEPSALPDEWKALLAIVPEATADTRRFIRARQRTAEDTALPAGLRRALALPQRLAGEWAYLEAAIARQPSRADLTLRAANLRERLTDEAGLAATVRAEVRERLTDLADEAALAAAEHLALEPFRQRLAVVARAEVDAGAFDDTLVNAAQLSVGLKQNRRLLRTVLRAHFAGDREWRERQPANRQFLAALAAQGGDAAAWAAPLSGEYACPNAKGGRVRLTGERDPLRVLQMGTIFGTCLSAGQFNAFSAVTNACEANKLVIYATDGTGRIVGRQLIAITDAWGLVGFRIYSLLPDAGGEGSLRACFRRYVVELAARCHLPLVNKGDVPILFAQDWYDDGIFTWRENKKPGRVGSRPGSSTAVAESA